MFRSAAAKTPNQVFTPRAASVNESMYINRPDLEQRLSDAIGSNKFIVIHGESGNGKTWLYKRVFSREKVETTTVNLSSVITAGSLDEAFRQKLGEMGVSETVTSENTVTNTLKPLHMGRERSEKDASRPMPRSPFTALLERVRMAAGKSKAALVLDNFEAVMGNDAALKQIAALIVSADDEAVAKFNVQIVIVGVPGNLKETVSRIANSTPVANRLTEIPEVARMTETEAKALMQKGFVDELKLKLEPGFADKLYSVIAWYSDRIAQHIHELCLIVSQEALRAGGVITQTVFDKAVTTWAADSLSSDMAVIEGAMNARDTKVGRKNQVLYAMGQCKSENFKYSEIEAIVRDEFDVGNAALNVSQILSAFADTDKPVIRRTPKQDAWRFVSPKFKMAIRSRLQKGADGKITVVSTD